MPALVGQRLDVAISDLEAVGVNEDDIEIVGGGTFGVLDESNWDVCEQRPESGSSELADVRLIVDRNCPDAAPNLTGSDDVPEPAVTVSPEAVEESPEALKPDSPAVFVVSVRRDLKDIRKDINDLDKALANGRLLRVAGNQLELAFNLGQLDARVPPSSFADTWTQRLSSLDEAIDDIGNQLDNGGSPQAVRDAIELARQEVKAGLAELKEFEDSLSN